LEEIIDRPQETQVCDADYQSALLFWNAFNTLIASIEIFRRGYSKEPAVLLRSMLEIISTAYDIHLHPEKLRLLRSGKYSSSKSIFILKKINPVIGKMYGTLSNMFAHVNAFHTLPQGSYKLTTKTFWIGGGFSVSHKKWQVLMLSKLTMALDIANAVMEIVFYDEIKKHRFWTKEEDGKYKHLPIKRIRQRGMDIGKKMQMIFKKQIVCS